MNVWNLWVMLYLGAVISHIIMERYEDFSEGDLSKMRAAVVNKEALAGIIKKLGINRFIILGKGEQENNGQRKRFDPGKCLRVNNCSSLF